MLVVSTDPAHSLGDALRKKLSARVTVVAPAVRPADAGPKPRATAKGVLYALELDARRAFARWLVAHRRPLGDILEQGTWLDREDVEGLLDLSIPGLDELVGLLEITRLSRTGIADLIVVDTAPTGHTLRLLASPETVGAVARVLDALHEQHRLIRDQLARVGRPEASDRLIELLAGQAREMAGRLRDPDQSTVHWVTLAEDLSLAETSDAVTTLDRSRLHVEEIIVNRVVPDGGPCPMCDGRRSAERRVIATIRRQLGRGRKVRVIAAELEEPTGVKALATLGKLLAGRPRSKQEVAQAFRPANAALKRRATVVRAAQDRAGVATVAAETLDAFAGAKLLFFGGKGGVGKTTVAAAAALRLAKAHPKQRVLLMSTDPAHSLGDVFATKVSDSPAPFAGAPPNLLGREVDAASAWTLRRAAVESALEDLAAAVGSGSADRTSARVSELMDLAPPGVDELFGVLSVFEARDEYDLIVIDTAPTGHALRLLAMPDVVHEWVQTLMRVLLKYRALVRPGQLAAELVSISRSIGELRAFLRNARHARFIVVTRPAELPGAETDRLLRSLRRSRLAVPAVIANAMTLSPGRCERCRATASAERRHLRALRRRLGGHARGCAIIQTPLSAPPPRGARALERWGARWIVNRADG